MCAPVAPRPAGGARTRDGRWRAGCGFRPVRLVPGCAPDAAGHPDRRVQNVGGCPMKLTGVELRRIRMPLVAPFRTSFGTELDRDVLLLRVVTADAEGWGECVAMSHPLYSSEYVDAAAD